MSDPVTCRRCGHANVAGANFCSSCGSPLAASIDEPTESLVMPGEIVAEVEGTELGFMVTRGPKAGSRYLLDPGISTLGRHPQSTIFFDDVTVSRRHAEVEVAGSRAVVRDVGSLNGTYVNQRQTDGDVELDDGDVVQIGKFKLVFFRGDGR